jgi:hypothetical protein
MRLCVFAADQDPSNSRTLPLIGVLRLRGNFAERSFHSAQDVKLLLLNPWLP